MTTSATPIDPFSPAYGGVYRDPVVEVRNVGPTHSRRGLRAVRTSHFQVEPQAGGGLTIEHTIPQARVDDDLAGLLSDELFRPGWLRGPELFERIFTGVVITSAEDPLAAWELFYRNTLQRLEETLHAPPILLGSPSTTHGTLAGYAPVYRHVESLIGSGTALELGSSFGFLSLRMALQGRQVVAADINPGTVRLMDAVTERLGVALPTLACDAASIPYPDSSVDVVLAIHLLEHLDPQHGDRVIAEALRLARRQVVIAVPLEHEADETWGHLRTVSLADLEHWGRRSGLPFEVHEHHGGWLVLYPDQAPPLRHPS